MQRRPIRKAQKLGRKRDEHIVGVHIHADANISVAIVDVKVASLRVADLEVVGLDVVKWYSALILYYYKSLHDLPMLGLFRQSLHEFSVPLHDSIN